MSARSPVFPQLDRLSDYKSPIDDLDEEFNHTDDLPAEYRVTRRRRKLATQRKEDLPVDEVVRRINSGEYPQ